MVEIAAATITGRAEKLDPNVPPIEEPIAHERHFLITNPNPPPLGPNRHREPLAGPARNSAREERTGTIQRVDIELWVAFDQAALGKMLRVDHVEKYSDRSSPNRDILLCPGPSSRGAKMSLPGTPVTFLALAMTSSTYLSKMSRSVTVVTPNVTVGRTVT